ncbi:MAG TPA: DUF1918 domain-containing protein [Streptosporangiaceae bacterium]|nr:DUF1918 domain-containing protein [Streptosporangiaceae bacterium]
MQAAVDDTLTVKAVRKGESDRHGRIIEVHGKDGEPPYLVRWQDEHESLFFPAAGTVVDHHRATPQPSAR